MNFSLSEEQEMLQQTVRGFVEKECPPARVREVFDSESGEDQELWGGLVDMGIAGLVVPEHLGGAGLELLELALVAEELGRGAVPSPLLGHALATLALVLGGSDAQRERWLPALAAGEARATVALGEPQGHWQPEEWTVPLEGGRISGAKDFVLGGARADLLVVGCAGGSLALVERSAPGVRLEDGDAVDQGRRHALLTLQGTPAEPLPGAAAAARLRDAALVLLAAEAFGAAWKLVRMSAAYTSTREQFGQPLAQFQALKHQLANMAVAIDTTRGIWWYAAHAFDHVPEEAERAAALAKAHVTEQAMQVARDAVEAHGGIGFTWECDVQIWFKRVLFARQYLGTPAAHRERIAQLGGW